MGTPVPAVTEPSHTPPAVECLPSPVCPWQLSAASGRPLSRPPAVSPPPPRGLTLTPLPSSSWPDPGLGLDPCSDPSSLDTQGIPASNSSCSRTLSSDSLCPRPWVSSV